MKKKHTLPADIERTSMGIIADELRSMGIVLPPENDSVVRRVIHTSADFDYAKTLHFTPDAVRYGVQALKDRAVIVTDTNMACAGISKPSLSKLGTQAVCYMANDQIIQEAKREQTTRAAASMSYAVSQHEDAVFAIGNAPTALIRLSELIRKGYRPRLVIGVPVGFVNVVESKREIFSLCTQCGIPAIVAMERKGGSTIAAAICNALLYTAADTLDPAARGWQG